MKKFKSARELLEIAGATSSKVLPDEVAETLPLMTQSGTDFRVVILYYREPLRKGLIYPPHYFIILDATSGKVVRFEPCTPETFGIAKPAEVPEKGTGLNPSMTPNEFWSKNSRFLELSKTVWEAFASGSSTFDPPTREMIKEYYSLFQEVAKRPLLPYYRAVASDFLDWLERASK